MKLDQTHDITSYIKKFIIDNENKLQKKLFNYIETSKSLTRFKKSKELVTLFSVLTVDRYD